jgi:hypothetical protein
MTMRLLLLNALNRFDAAKHAPSNNTKLIEQSSHIVL